MDRKYHLTKYRSPCFESLFETSLAFFLLLLLIFPFPPFCVDSTSVAVSLYIHLKLTLHLLYIMFSTIRCSTRLLAPLRRRTYATTPPASSPESQEMTPKKVVGLFNRDPEIWPVRIHKPSDIMTIMRYSGPTHSYGG